MSLFQKVCSQLLCQFLLAARPEAVIFPENETAGPIRTRKVLLALINRLAAARAGTDHFLLRGKQLFAILGNAGIGGHDLPDHIPDTVHEGIRVSTALCDLRQFLIPLRRQHGRGQRLRQDRDQVDTGFCGDQALALTLHKSGCHQLFDDSRPGRRRAKTFSLCLVGDIVLARVLHSGQKGIFGVGLRRLGEMLGNGNLRTVKSLPFGEVRERAAVPINRLFFQGGTENAVDLPPALGEDALALCGEGMAAAVKGGLDRLIFIRFRRRTQ